MRRSLFFLILAATGCGVFDRIFGRDELTVLRRNQGKWRALGITDYDYTYSRMCFCPVELTTPMRVSVRGGVVTSVINPATDEEMFPQPYTWWPTIDTLFVWTERNIRGDYRLDITYDGTFHFPGRVVGDVPFAIDDEYTSLAVKLVPVVK